MREPFPHQQVAFDKGIERNLLLADQCGLGKTFSSMLIAKGITNSFQREVPTLIVCPKPLKGQWQDEILAEWPSDQVIVLDKPQTLHLTSKTWLITHYEQLLRIPLIDRVFFGTVIVDEGHRIKNREAQRTRAVKKLTAYRKVLLTGTPLDRNVADLWSLLNFLYPEQFKSYWKFFYEHVKHEVDWFQHLNVLPGAIDPVKLAKLLEPFTLARKKSEVAPDMPLLTKTIIEVELTPSQKRMYRQLKKSKDWFAEIEGLGELEIKNKLSKLIKFQQITADPRLLGGDEEGAKIGWVKEYIEDNPAEQIAIFTRFKGVATRLARELNGAVITGDGEERVKEWKAGELKLLFATIDSVAEGRNLPEASTSICLDQHWSPIMMAQLDERIHRLGIKEAKQVIYLYAKGTIDREVVKNLEEAGTEATLIYRALRHLSE